MIMTTTKKLKNILYDIALNSIFTVIELVGGILSNSLALLSDTIHDFSDSVALGISYYANQKDSHHQQRL